MIKIKELPEGNPLIISSVSDFCDSMGYCEYKIKHFLRGIRPPQTEITMAGTKAQKEEEEYEKEHFKFIPITEEKLADFKKDVEFAREAIYTRFFSARADLLTCFCQRFKHMSKPFRFIFFDKYLELWTKLKEKENDVSKGDITFLIQSLTAQKHI